MHWRGGQFESGWTVYGRDDEKIGEISEVGPTYLLVRKGWLFTRDIYVPLAAVDDVQGDRVILNVRKDEIETLAWDQVPADETYRSSEASTTRSTMDVDRDTTMTGSSAVTDRALQTQDSTTMYRSDRANEDVRIP